MENSYSREIEEYYGNALAVIAKLQNTGMYYTKINDERPIGDKILLAFSEQLYIHIPKELEGTLTREEVQNIYIDILAYLVKRYKGELENNKIQEINEQYLYVVDNILMKSIKENQKEISDIQKNNNCTFYDAVQIFYDYKTEKYFFYQKGKKYYDETGKNFKLNKKAHNKKEPEER